jgi:hypothetical protein
MIYTPQHNDEGDGTKLLSASSQPLLGTTITSQFINYNYLSYVYDKYM